jgi:hypothetical protein
LNAELDTTKNNHFDQVFKKGVKHKAIEILIASYIDEINDGLNKAKIFAPSKRGDNFQRADYFLNVQLFMYFKRPNFMNIFLDVLSEITEK